MLMSVAAELRELFSEAVGGCDAAPVNGWMIWRRHPTSGAREWWSGRYWSGERLNARTYSERREAWIAAGQLPAADVEAAGVFVGPHGVEPMRGAQASLTSSRGDARRGGAVERFFAERDASFAAARPDLALSPCPNCGQPRFRGANGEQSDCRNACAARGLIGAENIAQQLDAAQARDWKPDPEVIHLAARDNWRRRCDNQVHRDSHTIARTPEVATCRACLAALVFAAQQRIDGMDGGE